MEAIIENKILLLDENNNELFQEFNEIVGCINDAINYNGLEAMMPIQPKFFKYGFGGSHMWVKQIINGEPRQQVLFVKF